MTQQWHYTLKGKPHGPVTEDRLKDLITDGTITRYEQLLKVSEGKQKWQPLGVYFDELLTYHQEPRPKTLRDALLLIAGVGLVIVPFILFRGDRPLIGMASAFVGVIGVYIFGYKLLRGIFIWGKVLKVTNHRALGWGLQIITAFLGTIILFYATHIGSQTPLKFNTAKTEKPYVVQKPKPRPSYQLQALPPEQPTRLVIKGTIAPGFAEDLEKNLANFPSVEYLAVNLKGGSLIEAMRAARLIENTKWLAVYANEQCDHTCLILLMAANKRWARPNTTFAINGIPYQYDENIYGKRPVDMRKLRIEADQYLKKRNLPSELLTYGFNSGKTEQVYKFTTDDLMNWGALTGIVSNGKVAHLRPKVMKKNNPKPGQVLTFVPNNMGQEEFAALNTLLKALSRNLPEYAQMFPGLLASQHSADGLTMKIRIMMNAFRSQYVMNIGSKEALRHVKALLAQTQAIAEKKHWKVCHFYSDDLSAIARKYLEPSLLPETYLSFAEMVNSATPANSMEIFHDIDRTIAKLQSQAARTFHFEFSGASGTPAEREYFAGCARELELMASIINAPENIAPQLAKIYLATRLR